MIPVLVPWRTDSGPRAEVWRTLKPLWQMRHDVYEGTGPLAGPFNRSAALNEAARAAGDWRVAVIADADSWVPSAQVEEAAVVAMHTGRLMVAHNGNWRSFDREWNLIEEVRRGAKSSVLVIRRDLWDTVGGFDERFIGWGHEDGAFAHACTIASGKPFLRVGGHVTHLEHGAKNTLRTLRAAGDEQLEANRILEQRYLNCPDIDGLRALIAERTAVVAHV